MSSEKMGFALNTLICKPVFRDTIINGKIVSCTVFLLCVFGFAVCLYTASVIVLCGEAAGYVMTEYVLRLPFVLFLAVLSVLFYTYLSLLISILVRRPGVALLLTAILYVFIDHIVTSVTFLGSIVTITGNDQIHDLIRSLSPYTILSNIVIFGGLFDSSVSISDMLGACWHDFAWLFVYVASILFMCYGAFLRRDIS